MTGFFIVLGILILTFSIPAALIFGTRFFFRYWRMKKINKVKNIDLTTVLNHTFNKPDHPQVQNPKRDPKGDRVILSENFAQYPVDVTNE